MIEEVYRQLLEAMKKRGGGYSGMDIPEFFEMVEEMFTPEEAAINNALPKDPFTADALAEKIGRDKKEVREILEGMADKGLCTALNVGGAQFYQSARFMPGILEFQFMGGKTGEREKKLPRLIYAYKKAYDERGGGGKMSFPTSRAITVDRTVKAGNRVHTYDQVQTYIDKYDQICVSTCYCRHAAALRDEDTHGLPNDVCMSFGMGAQFVVERLGGRKLTKQEAREVLERSEEAGLIHMSQNTTDDIGFICNCDRWHCTLMKSVLKQSRPALFFNSGFEPRFDAELCTSCETCIDRCPASALNMGEESVPQVDLDRCFGCAVCATGCPSEAVSMVNKPGFPQPPKDGKALREAMKAAAAR